MSVFHVEDLDRPELAPYRNLKHHAQRGAEDFVVESTLVIERLLSSSYRVHSLLLTPQRYDHLKAQIPSEVPVFVADKPLLSELVGFDVHRGCLERAGVPTAQKTLKEIISGGCPQTVLLMEGLADPANVGTIVRNAAAFGVDLIISDPRGASPFSRRAARTSAGHIFSLPMVEHAPVDALKLLKEQYPAIQALAATPAPSARPLNDFQRSGPLILLVGNEGRGLSVEVLASADHQLRIPMAEGVDSLNVSASVAVLLYALNECVSR